MLYPFLDYQSVTARVLRELRALFARHRAFNVQLVQARRFPGVLYLAPAPEAQLRALTSAVVTRWPETPPYRGQFEDVVPHLTVADDQRVCILEMIESHVARQLPVSTRMGSVCLMTFTDRSWQEEHSFPLADD